MGITLAILPVNIAFFSNQFFLEWTVINCFMDMLFMGDIVLNFFTGVVYNGNEVREGASPRSRGAPLYMKGIGWRGGVGRFVVENPPDLGM